MGAIVLGLIAGVVCFFFCSAVKNALGYDDALDVFGVHCIGGIVGAIVTGILVNPALGGTGIMDYATGKIADYDFVTQMIAQCKAVLHDAGVVGRRHADHLQGGRRDHRPARRRPRREREGLDLTDHGERAYHDAETRRLTDTVGAETRHRPLRREASAHPEALSLFWAAARRRHAFDRSLGLAHSRRRLRWLIAPLTSPSYGRTNLARPRAPAAEIACP